MVYRFVIKRPHSLIGGPKESLELVIQNPINLITERVTRLQTFDDKTGETSNVT